MGWTIKISKTASKSLHKLDKQAQKRILTFLDELKERTNPRSTGKPLTAYLKGFWRYRLGDYRIICDIKDKELTLLAVKIAHRKEVY